MGVRTVYQLGRNLFQTFKNKKTKGEINISKSLKLIFTVPSFQPTQQAHDVPLVFREPCIKSGFRASHRPWTYYLLSLFQIHNELINMWSHLVACLIFLYLTITYAIELDFTTNPQSWGLLAFGFGCVFYAFVSTFAHMFHSKSEVMHYTCFQIDYIGIGMYGHAMGMLLFFCSGTKEFYATFGSIYIPINTILSITVCVCSCIAKLKYTRPYPPHRKLLQMGSSTAQVLFIYTPMYYRFYNCIVGYQDGTNTLLPHFVYGLLFFVSIAFFASHMPEKFLPGKCDIFGHGHQIFHILITVTTVKQFQAGFSDLKHAQESILSGANPSLYAILGSIFVVIVVDSIFIHCMRPQVLKAVRRDSKHENESAALPTSQQKEVYVNDK